MRKIILDTNYLVSHWRQSRGHSLTNKTVADAKKWAIKLIDIHQTNAILTPIYLEFICGVINRHEMELSKAFLGQFQIIDEGKIKREDWSLARQLAERIPPGTQPTRRGAVDCLIRAIARRLQHDLMTFDKGMPR